jgi:type II secretory pathway pseudopilin PulG
MEVKRIARGALEPTRYGRSLKVSGLRSWVAMHLANISGRHRTCAGFSLGEVLMACAVVGTILAIATPRLLGFQDAARGAAAARRVANRLHGARMEALKRSAHVAVAFFQGPTEIEYAAYLDANGNGVRGSEIADGIDQNLSARERLGDLFPGAVFGVVEGTPSIDGTGPLTGGDPIRVGRSALVSFSPLGGATPGTIYIRGPDRQQWAIRITGATGRVRVFVFDAAARKWLVR